MNAAFQSYLEKFQQSVAYVRRTGSMVNPDNRGLGIVGQTSKGQPGKPGVQSVAEVGQGAWHGEVLGEEHDDGEFIEELDEEQIAYVQGWEDERFTQFVEANAQMVPEASLALMIICLTHSFIYRNWKL